MWRIRDRDTFVELRRAGRRVRRGPLSVTWVAGSSATPPRVAYAVGRPLGGSVVRNRVRRRLRAVMGESSALLRPGAYLISAAPGTERASSAELRAWVQAALRELPDPGADPAAVAGSAGRGRP